MLEAFKTNLLRTISKPLPVRWVRVSPIRRLVTVIVCGLLTAATPGFAANNETVLHSFSRRAGDGVAPAAGLISDAAGNLYTTTTQGGGTGCVNGLGCGTVVRLKPGKDGRWNEKVIFKFSGSNGYSGGDLSSDRQGNLYGITGGGGNMAGCPQTFGCGTAFEMTPGVKGKWTEKVLYAFCEESLSCLDGAYPQGSVVFDSAGNLYGTTNGGGAHNLGTVFRLTPLQNGGWTEKVLYSFGDTNNDGNYPFASLIMDSAGSLYGTTTYGGAYQFGVVYRLTSGANDTWSETILYNFCTLKYCDDGAGPIANLIFDAAGDLYGTASGGGTGGQGVVFELTPDGSGQWTETVLYSFAGGSDGNDPASNLIFDTAGNLYGTTFIGGGPDCSGIGCGTVFRLSLGQGGRWTETVLYSFTGLDGNEPDAGLILDAAGNLYGTTRLGGAYSLGTVFEITP